MTGSEEQGAARDLSAEERDRRVLELYEQVTEIEQRLIPTGLHVFGRAPESGARLDMLRMVASFDRPESGARAPDSGLSNEATIRSMSRRAPDSGARPKTCSPVGMRRCSISVTCS